MDLSAVNWDEVPWRFDCPCGASGEDDHTPMVCCSKCDTWAHTSCALQEWSHHPERCATLGCHFLANMLAAEKRVRGRQIEVLAAL